MGIINAFAGSVRVELTSANVTGTLQQLNDIQILLFDIQMIDDLTVQFTISYRDFGRIRELVKRKGDCITVVSREGILWYVLRLKSRPVLILFMMLLVFATMLLPNRIYFVEVEGNEHIPDNLILETASEAGIGFGASRRDVRSEKMKNKLLSLLPQLQWAGVNTYGCAAVISVKERSAENHDYEYRQVSRVVASCDGVITSCVVTRGTGICRVGQAVRKGQVLISGYTDHSGVVMAGRAEGEIFAQTRHEMTAVAVPEASVRTDPEAGYAKYSLRIGKKRINLYKGSGISDSSCAKMTAEYHFTLPGGYVLPLTLVREQYLVYRINEQQAAADQLSSQMSEYVQSLLRSEFVALSVVGTEETFDDTRDVITLNGIYSCVEMIGREQGEQIGELYNETD